MKIASVVLKGSKFSHFLKSQVKFVFNFTKRVTFTIKLNMNYVSNLITIYLLHMSIAKAVNIRLEFVNLKIW